MYKEGAVVHACNPSIKELRQEDQNSRSFLATMWVWSVTPDWDSCDLNSRNQKISTVKEKREKKITKVFAHPYLHLFWHTQTHTLHTPSLYNPPSKLDFTTHWGHIIHKVGYPLWKMLWKIEKKSTSEPYSNSPSSLRPPSSFLAVRGSGQCSYSCEDRLQCQDCQLLPLLSAGS